MKAFLLFKDKVLILRESPNYEEGTNKGRYDLVGGRVAPGENFANALLREIKEETSLDAQIGKPILVDEWYPIVKGEQWHVIGVSFKCSANSDQIMLNGDHDDYKWIDPKDYKNYPLTTNAYNVFDAYLKENN